MRWEPQSNASVIRSIHDLGSLSSCIGLHSELRSLNVGELMYWLRYALGCAHTQAFYERIPLLGRDTDRAAGP